MAGASTRDLAAARPAWLSVGRWLPELLAVVLLLPVMISIVQSFTAETRFAYAYWWASSRGWRLLGDSLVFESIAATAGVLGGGAVAILLARSAGRIAAVTFAALALPLVSPASLVAKGWILALGRDGMLAQALRSGGLEPAFSIYDLIPAAIASGLRLAVVPALIIWPAWRSVGMDDRIAAILGVPWRSRVWHLRARRVAAPIIAAWLIVFILRLNDPIMSSAFMFQTYATHVLIELSQWHNASGALALTGPVAMVGVVLALLSLRLLRGSARHRQPRKGMIDRPMRLRLALAAWVVLMVVAAPMASLVATTGTLEQVWNVLDPVHDRSAVSELAFSAEVAAAGCLAVISVAAILASHMCRQAAQRRPTLAALVLVNLLVPPALLAIGTVWMQSQLRPWLELGGAAMVFAWVARYAPLVAVMFFLLWRGQLLPDPAARAHRVRPIDHAWHIAWRPRLAHLGIAVFGAALLVLADLELSTMLVPAGVTTLSVRLYTMIHNAPDEAVSALAVVQLVLVLVLVALGVAFATGARRLGGVRR